MLHDQFKLYEETFLYRQNINKIQNSSHQR